MKKFLLSLSLISVAFATTPPEHSGSFSDCGTTAATVTDRTNLRPSQQERRVSLPPLARSPVDATFVVAPFTFDRTAAESTFAFDVTTAKLEFSKLSSAQGGHPAFVYVPGKFWESKAERETAQKKAWQTAYDKKETDFLTSKKDFARAQHMRAEEARQREAWERSQVAVAAAASSRRVTPVEDPGVLEALRLTNDNLQALRKDQETLREEVAAYTKSRAGSHVSRRSVLTSAALEQQAALRRATASVVKPAEF